MQFFFFWKVKNETHFNGYNSLRRPLKSSHFSGSLIGLSIEVPSALGLLPWGNGNMVENTSDSEIKAYVGTLNNTSST